MPLVTAKEDLPAVSVIVPSYNSRGTLPRCLDALYAQDCEENYEILLVDSSDDGTAELVQERYPEVRLIRYSEKTLAGKGRNRGAREARGSILACTDADCVVSTEWLRQHLLRQREWDVVSGSFGNANPESLVSWASYLSMLNGFTPSGKCRQLRIFPSGNVSYRREIFDHVTFAEDLATGEDTLFHWTLSAAYRCCFDGSIVVSHTNRTKLTDYLTYQTKLGLGAALVRQRGNQRGRFLVRYPILAFLTPFYRLAILFARILRDTPRYLPPALLVSPLILLGGVAWALGFSQESNRIRAIKG